MGQQGLRKLTQELAREQKQNWDRLSDRATKDGRMTRKGYEVELPGGPLLQALDTQLTKRRQIGIPTEDWDNLVKEVDRQLDGAKAGPRPTATPSTSSPAVEPATTS
eukprot:RCo006255